MSTGSVGSVDMLLVNRARLHQIPLHIPPSLSRFLSNLPRPDNNEGDNDDCEGSEARSLGHGFRAVTDTTLNNGRQQPEKRRCKEETGDQENVRTDSHAPPLNSFGSTNQLAQKKKAGLGLTETGLFDLIPAVTYVPTQLPVQYHRLSEA